MINATQTCCKMVVIINYLISYMSLATQYSAVCILLTLKNILLPRFTDPQLLLKIPNY